jgi:hypothetical protein
VNGEKILPINNNKNNKIQFDNKTISIDEKVTYNDKDNNISCEDGSTKKIVNTINIINNTQQTNNKDNNDKNINITLDIEKNKDIDIDKEENSDLIKQSSNNSTFNLLDSTINSIKSKKSGGEIFNKEVTYTHVKSKIDTGLNKNKNISNEDEQGNDELRKKYEIIQNEKQEKLKEYREMILQMKKEKRKEQKDQVFYIFNI